MAGNYSITVTAGGYKTKTISSIGVALTGSTIINFQLVPEQNWYASGVISSRIPVSSFTGFTDPAFTPAVLGAPDNVGYSLWKNGWIILDMGDTIFNGSGNDFRVAESGTTPEGFTCYAGQGKDGPWTTIGQGTGTTAFDFSMATGGSVDKSRYLKIVDDGDGPTSGSALGFDLDAIEMITPPLLVNFSARGSVICAGETMDFTDQSGGNPVSWAWQFPGGNPPFSSVQNPSGIIYQNPGTHNVSLTISNGTSSAGKLKPGYIHVDMLPVVDLGADTTLDLAGSILLDAGNPGSRYLWSNGDTLQTITVDSTGTGNGTKVFSVIVTDENSCKALDTIRITFSDLTGVINIYPNPTNGVFQIALPGNGIWEIKVITMLGNVVVKKESVVDEHNVSVDLTGLPEGIYFIELSGGTKKYFDKVMIR